MKIKISLACEIDECGNLLGYTVDAKSCRRGPFLLHSFVDDSYRQVVQNVMKATFDLDQMRKPGLPEREGSER